MCDRLLQLLQELEILIGFETAAGGTGHACKTQTKQYAGNSFTCERFHVYSLLFFFFVISCQIASIDFPEFAGLISIGLNHC